MSNRTVVRFPYTILGDELDGKKHDYNSINGGMIQLEDLGLKRNRFFGGNVTELGLITEYGFYACPRSIDVAGTTMKREIVGFYVHDGEQVTELGRKVLTERLPDCDIRWSKEDVKQPRVMTAEEIERRNALIAKASESGAPADVFNLMSTTQIQDYINLLKAGKNEKAQVQMAEPVISDAFGPKSIPHPSRKKNVSKPIVPTATDRKLFST